METGTDDVGSLGPVAVVVICKFWTRAAFVVLLAEWRGWVAGHSCPPLLCRCRPAGVRRDGEGNDPVSK